MFRFHNLLLREKMFLVSCVHRSRHTLYRLPIGNPSRKKILCSDRYHWFRPLRFNAFNISLSVLDRPFLPSVGPSISLTLRPLLPDPVEPTEEVPGGGVTPLSLVGVN